MQRGPTLAESALRPGQWRHGSCEAPAAHNTQVQGQHMHTDAREPVRKNIHIHGHMRTQKQLQLKSADA